MVNKTSEKDLCSFQQRALLNVFSFLFTFPLFFLIYILHSRFSVSNHFSLSNLISFLVLILTFICYNLFITKTTNELENAYYGTVALKYLHWLDDLLCLIKYYGDDDNDVVLPGSDVCIVDSFHFWSSKPNSRLKWWNFRNDRLWAIVIW